MARDSELIGRRFELAALRDLLDEARLGAGQVVFVEGDAGIGKTRLLADLLEHATREGFQVLAGGASELGRERPFGVLVDALSLEAGSGDAERAEIARLIAGGASSPASTDLGFRIVESLVALVERIAAGGPLVLALDDLHWADPSTLRALGGLHRALAQLPVLVVATMRPAPVAPLDRAMDELGRGARHVVLEPLGEDDACALAAAVSGLPAGEELSRKLTPARGNPLFLIELAVALRSGASGEGGGASLPRTILRRVETLPDDAVEVLKVAAVLGRRFLPSQLSSVTDRSPVELLPALDRALAAGILVEEGDALAFRHELIRDAIFGQIPLALRAGLHREAARALGASGAPPAQVVEHLLIGAEPGDPEAVDVLARAARRCAAQAPQEAVKLLERARGLVDADDPASGALAADLAPLLVQTGRAAEAEQLTQDVLARCPLPHVEAALRRSLGEVLWTKGWLEAAVGELEAAAAVSADTGLAAERAGSLALAAYLKLFLGAPGPARDQALWASAEAARLGDDFAACLAAQTLALAADASGNVGEAVELAQEAVRIAAQSQDPRVGQLNPHLSLGFILFDADRFDEADAVLERGRLAAEERGTVSWLPLYHCALAMRRVLDGNWDDGLAEVEAGLSLADEVGTRLYVPFLHGLAAWVTMQRGDLGAAARRLEEAKGQFVPTLSASWQAAAGVDGFGPEGARWPLEWGLWITGLLLEANGALGKARAVLDDAWAVAAPLRFFLGYRLFGPDLVRVAMACGHRDRASVVASEVDEGARRSGIAGAAAAALRCRGLLDDDPDVLLQAVEAYRSTPRLVELAFALEDAGGALARRGRDSEAVASLQEALAVFDGVGADLPVNRIDAALRSLGVRRRRVPAGTGAASGWASLTPTELRVAHLAGDGLTNRQIGERLFVSRRTIETHLAHAFRKLGLSTRAQLAAEVGRRAGTG